MYVKVLFVLLAICNNSKYLFYFCMKVQVDQNGTVQGGGENHLQIYNRRHI